MKSTQVHVRLDVTHLYRQDDGGDAAGKIKVLLPASQLGTLRDIILDIDVHTDLRRLKLIGLDGEPENFDIQEPRKGKKGKRFKKLNNSPEGKEIDL